MRRDVAVLAGAFVASRAIVLAAALAAEHLVVRNPALTSGDAAPVLRSLTSWDGWWYLAIVRDGYHAAPLTGAYHDYAFLPLYPLLVAFLSLPWPAWVGLVAVLVSNAAFAAALVLLERLGRPYLGRRSADAAALLAVFPFAAVFSMAYAESLFLALSLGAFLAAERGRRGIAGILLALAALTRLQGILLVVPLAILFLRQDGWRLRASLAWLLAAPAATLGFFAYVAALTGEPRAYLEAQIAWGRAGVGAAPPGQNLGSVLSPTLVLLLVILGVAVFLLVYMRPDRMRLEYALVPILYVGAVFGSGLLESVGRYVMLAFPYAWILARRRNVLFRRAWPALSAGLLGLFALLGFGGYFVP
ncbi:MAG: hypothetical protein A2X23_13040 [Chloroflexi bacterium GWC2_73_18]|nr:MAG: hypothetical protein A2X23_13040 [Chloroflexi bacterium GWC2_73_18]